MCGGAACGPTPVKTASTSPSPAQISPSPQVTPNPHALGPNDCIAAPTGGGSTVHSASLGFTLTLPTDWAEDPANEGQHGMQSALYVATGASPTGTVLSFDLMPLAMSPHDGIDWLASQPGSGTVIAKGDCTIGGDKAAYFESNITFTVFPGITRGGDGYAVLAGHAGKLVYLDVLLPDGNAAAAAMPAVKSILGSWRWDASA
jgi:hypothetical protein